MERSIKFWNKRSKIYDISVYEKYKTVYDETASLARKYLKPGDHALDFACGSGSLTLDLAGSVQHILAIDTSDMMIELANKKAKDQHIENVEFRNTGIFDPALEPGSFDVVMAFNIFQFIRDENTVLERISALLNDNGIFIQATATFLSAFTRSWKVTNGSALAAANSVAAACASGSGCGAGAGFGFSAAGLAAFVGFSACAAAGFGTSLAISGAAGFAACCAPAAAAIPPNAVAMRSRFVFNFTNCSSRDIACLRCWKWFSDENRDASAR